MPYRKWEQIEARYAPKKMAEILADLYAELGDHAPVAQRLGVTMKTLREWRNFSDCTTVIRVQCAIDDCAPAPTAEGTR